MPIVYSVYCLVPLTETQRALLDEELADGARAMNFDIQFDVRPYHPAYADMTVKDLVQGAIRARFQAPPSGAIVSPSAGPATHQEEFRKLYGEWFEHGKARGDPYTMFVLDERCASTLDPEQAEESFHLLTCAIESYLPEEAVDMFYHHRTPDEDRFFAANPAGSRERARFLKREIPELFEGRRQDCDAGDDQMSFWWTMRDPEALPDQTAGDRFVVLFVARAEVPIGIQTLSAAEVKEPAGIFAATFSSCKSSNRGVATLE